ncbi:5-oxoprolinase subunit PxpB [Seonamhaeicola sp.]|uniref:5-oxoprolinase subunit PxpB n=1 Tax=Seonamhaeicola sp. TaxID=1912245 RepID=UPI002613E3C1|nr:5-oxoprolinase subunit PxpB [Seonamhaeicola sp.]
MDYQLTFKPYGARAILIEWPPVIDEGVLYDVLGFKEKIRKESIKGLLDVNHAYNSLLVVYNDFLLNFKDEIEVLKTVYEKGQDILKSTYRLWRIPVCYDTRFGIDLEALSVSKSLSIDTIIKLHSQPIYTVYFIGFLPGFLYLGGLDEVLHTPRKATPRLKIEKGAVAIGGNQTGVYPDESPGGWNIIGNSPIDFFDIKEETPCFAAPGDQIQFHPVSLKEYQDIKTLVEAGVYQIESEVIDD